MPAKKLTPEHRAKLHALTTVHSEHVLAKSTLRAEIEEAYRDRLHGLVLRESQLMNEAKLAGVPKTMIAAAVGTSNWAALEAKYALTASEFVNAEPVELGPQWTIPAQAETEHGAYRDGAPSRKITLNWIETAGTLYTGPFDFWVYWDDRDDIWAPTKQTGEVVEPYQHWASENITEVMAAEAYLEEALGAKWGRPVAKKGQVESA